MANKFHIDSYILATSILIIICLNIGWLIKCIRILLIVVKKYQTCKQTPIPNSVDRGVQFLSQQRNLYNLKTHMVKYALSVLCIYVELIFIIWFTFSHIITSVFKLNTKQNTTLNEIEQEYSNCHFRNSLTRVYFFPSYIIIVNVNYLLFFLLFVSLSILTRYLACRYLNHPFRTILIKYLVWLFLQFLIVAFCCTIYTLAFSLILFPLLSIVNWLVLLRDNRLLCRNLKSNLREVELFAYSKTLYREQLFAFKFYRIFQKILLLSLFFLVLVIFLKHTFYICFIILDSYCILNVVYGFGISLNITISSHAVLIFEEYSTLSDGFIFGLYTFSTVLPLMCITLFPSIHECIKRYNSRNFVYRYNYENIQPLLRRRNL